MTAQPGMVGVWRRVLLLWMLVGNSGCMCYLHPVGPPPCELADPCRSLPKCCRDHVYIFLVHGLDPVNYANLSGVRDYVQGLGFNKTYYGQVYHGRKFESEVRRIHQEDAEARFVLIGFSVGGSVAHSMAVAVQDEDIHIDLLVYLDAKTFTNDLHQRPENVGRVLNILSSGTTWNGEPLDGAENVRMVDVRHFGTPTHQPTVAALAQALAEVAAAVPAPEPPAPAELPLAEDAPTPLGLRSSYGRDR